MIKTYWRHRLSGGLVVAAAVVGLLRLGAAAPVQAQGAASLQGNWVLRGWGDPDNLRPPAPGSTITANFEGDRLAGSSGCNNYGTRYEVQNSRLSVGPIAATRRACLSPQLSQQETQYWEALGGLQSYSRTAAGELHLRYATAAGSGVLVFVPEAIPGLW